jgi:hypothetical protein
MRHSAIIIIAWCMPLIGSFCRETEISGATTISRIANSASHAARRLMLSDENIADHRPSE